MIDGLLQVICCILYLLNLPRIVRSYSSSLCLSLLALYFEVDVGMSDTISSQLYHTFQLLWWSCQYEFFLFFALISIKRDGKPMCTFLLYKKINFKLPNFYLNYRGKYSPLISYAIALKQNELLRVVPTRTPLAENEY